jgi:SAM-dependent methyltransferase
MSNDNVVVKLVKKSLGFQTNSNCCSPSTVSNVTLIDSGQPTPTEVHAAVRDHYAARARNADSCCGPDAGESKGLYSIELLSQLPSDITNFTLGCGDPITLAELKSGETVLDLGSGGGLDCFLAARQVGESGHVIGVDMTPEMLTKARANASRLKVTNVEFREGYLESLPVADNSVDVVISNCVINLSPDKPQVFREVFRVLKPGGRVAVSDIVTHGQLPASVQHSLVAWGACVAGALDANDYVDGLKQAGFSHVQVLPKSDTDKALAALPGLPFSAVVTADKSSTGGSDSELTQTETIKPSDEIMTTLNSMMSRVTALNPIEDGYELILAGPPAETEALLKNILQAETGQFSFLHFEFQELPDGLQLRLTSQPTTATEN